MYIQLVWLTDFDTKTGVITDNRDHTRLGSIVDWRRGGKGFYLVMIETGDVYEVATTNPGPNTVPSSTCCICGMFYTGSHIASKLLTRSRQSSKTTPVLPLLPPSTSFKSSNIDPPVLVGHEAWSRTLDKF
ncbi:hypothetical protein QBC46DRAFT_405527 [Diplogelasinospora grovesii]|uniref:Uncharacterized protein n=1 Tax=Diplogelasinospora grovesii TaxID=303347 RepID=A0AAN6NCF9_9PEZI|nr:hypothetical protein QBC46DRAFT_405527 [Diplogelasinospora grovesii]